MELNIRDARPADGEQLAEIYAYYVEKTAVSFEYVPPTAEEMAARLLTVTAQYPWLAAESGGRLSGYAYAGPLGERRAYARSVELSIYVREGRHREGVGKALYTELERQLKVQGILNLNACIACPQGDDDPYLNGDSLRFHERMGYTMAGRLHKCGFKFGRWYDTVWMEKFLGPHTADPPRLIPRRQTTDK